MNKEKKHQGCLCVWLTLDPHAWGNSICLDRSSHILSSNIHCYSEERKRVSLLRSISRNKMRESKKWEEMLFIVTQHGARIRCNRQQMWERKHQVDSFSVMHIDVEDWTGKGEGVRHARQWCQVTDDVALAIGGDATSTSASKGSVLSSPKSERSIILLRWKQPRDHQEVRRGRKVLNTCITLDLLFLSLLYSCSHLYSGQSYKSIKTEEWTCGNWSHFLFYCATQKDQRSSTYRWTQRSQCPS